MTEKVIGRLNTLGYEVKAEDNFALTFCVTKTENTIKNDLNQSEIPEDLINAVVDRICGEFLYTKKQTGTLEGFDLETALKSVQTGNTNVTFAVETGASTEQRLDALFTYLINSGKGEFACYRTIKW